MTSSHQPIYYIHIGVPKTATTTIQSFLTVHRDRLLERGVLYPKSIANSNGHSELHRVLSAAIEPESVPWLASLRSSVGDGNVMRPLFEEAERTKAKTVILSAESLAFMQQPERLRRALGSYKARILVYLRRQDSFLISFYNQLIKSRLYGATFEEFLRQHEDNLIDVGDFRTPLPMCDYERLLNAWTFAFGHENVLVGVYEDYDLPIGILRDFAHKTGIDISHLSPPAEDTNPALSPAMLSLKRRVNQLLSSEAERVTSEAFFSSQVDVTKNREVTQEQIAINMVRRQAILARYQEGNARVALKFFKGRPFLFEPPSGSDPLLPDVCEKDWEAHPHGFATEMMAKLIAEVARRNN